MHVISSSRGALQVFDSWSIRDQSPSLRTGRAIETGVAALDRLMPGGAFGCGAVHEFLAEGSPAFLLPVLLAKSACRFGWIAWCDGERQFFPPAAAALGLPLDRLLLLRPGDHESLLWAAAESLRCTGIAACIVPVPDRRLSHLHVRRIQLAAETGRGAGILLRPASHQHQPYAAASRWLVRPAPSPPTAHRWTVQLLHGHGGLVGQTLLLEMSRDTHHVRAIDPLADGSLSAPAVRSA